MKLRNGAVDKTISEMALRVGPSPKLKLIHSLGSRPASRVARKQRWKLNHLLHRQKGSRQSAVPSVHSAFPPKLLPLPRSPPTNSQLSPNLTVASKSSVLFRRWSRFSPRAKIRSTFWVIIVFTPSTSLCRFLTRSFPARPPASSWMSIRG